jgi:hypothetical protein
MSKQNQIPNLPNDILWGADAIAGYIGRERHAAYYLIRKGLIPAKKLGPKTICARKSEIDRALAQQAEAE